MESKETTKLGKEQCDYRFYLHEKRGVSGGSPASGRYSRKLPCASGQGWRPADGRYIALAVPAAVQEQDYHHNNQTWLVPTTMEGEGLHVVCGQKYACSTGVPPTSHPRLCRSDGHLGHVTHTQATGAPL